MNPPTSTSIERLLEDEKEISRYECQKDRKPFRLIVTNYRLIFEVLQSHNYGNNFLFYVHQIDEIKSKVSTKDDQQLFMLQIIPKNNKSKVIRLANNSQLDQLKNDIKLSQLQQSPIAVAKMNILINHGVLQQQYEKLVLSKIISEEEFWEKEDVIQEYILFSNSLDQSLGKNIKSINIQMNEEEKYKLLKREPLVDGLYQKQVIDGDKSKDQFWNEFIKLQQSNNTILVNGLNPIYIPDNQSNQQQEVIDQEIDLVMNFETNDEQYDHEIQKKLNICKENGNKVNDLIRAFNNRSKQITLDYQQQIDNHMEVEEDHIQNNQNINNQDQQSNGFQTNFQYQTDQDMKQKQIENYNKVDNQKWKQFQNQFEQEINKFHDFRSFLKSYQSVVIDILKSSAQYQQNSSSTNLLVECQNYNKQVDDLLRFMFSHLDQYNNNQVYETQEQEKKKIKEIIGCLKEIKRTIEMAASNIKPSQSQKKFEKEYEIYKALITKIDHNINSIKFI